MGMLMHHTWLKQQEAMKAKTAVEEEIPFNEPVTEAEAKATAEAEESKRKTESELLDGPPPRRALLPRM